jgi:hypothetical protein
MSVFGPKYPYPLKEVVTHGERLCQLLARSESRTAPSRVPGDVWLGGRAQEVELVFEVTLFDWASGRMSMSEACRSLESYLGEVHAGACQHLGLSGVLECCENDVSLTAPSNAEVETVLASPRAPPAPISSSDTWFDPGAVLREVYGIEPGAKNDAAASARGAKR